MVSPQITNNNIEDNLQYSLRLGSTNISATNNWWGATHTQAINQTIYDFKNDFNLGIVNFVPFLNEPNPQAPIYINASSGVGGRISPSGIIKVNHGDDQSFSVIPENGYVIADVFINGTSIGAITPCTLLNVQGVTNISVAFTLAPVGPTQVSGILSKNTIWCSSGSPYILTGALGVVDGVTLTIEPGTVVNLGSNYIQVNGTLRAEGSENQLIKFSGIRGGKYYSKQC